MSSPIDHLVAVNTPVERRFYPRITPSVPIYVAFGPNNLGTLLNVSENGFQVVTPSRLDLNSVYRVFLSLDGLSSTITVSVRTIWTADSQNSSGIQLLDLSEEDRQHVRDWVAVQTSQNESLENWFTPKNTDSLPGIPEPLSAEAAEPSPPALESAWSAPVESSVPPLEPPSPAAATEPPITVARPTEHEFPPMPLPIHGDFTYEPPTARERKILRRRERKSRSRSRSPISGPILWTLFMLVICVAVGWPFRQKLSDLLLHLPEQFARVSAPPADTNPSVAAPDAPPPPATTEATSGADAVAKEADRNAAATSVNAGATSTAPTPTTADPKLVPPAVVATRRVAPKVSASKPNLDSIPNRSDQPEAPEVSHSYVADSAPLLTAASDARPPRVPTPEPASASATTVSSAPGPAPRTNTVSTPAPAAIRPTTDAQASRRSAITGSISNSSASAPLVSQQPSTVRSNSFEARNSNPSNSASSSASNSAPANSAVIQMDVADARVIEVTPPRNLTGNLTASYVNLPGERVLRSGSLTMHIARSVRIPGNRIPGERWIWRGHKKVVLGELESRVDPQVSQLPVPYGSITVLATIDKDGYVSDVKPLYGSLAFLPNVAGALRNWRYQTTYLDNKPAETQAQIEIDFRPPPTTRASRP